MRLRVLVLTCFFRAFSRYSEPETSETIHVRSSRNLEHLQSNAQALRLVSSKPLSSLLLSFYPSVVPRLSRTRAHLTGRSVSPFLQESGDAQDTEEELDPEKARIKAERKARKEAKQREKEEKKRKKEEQAARAVEDERVSDVSYLSIEEEGVLPYGDLKSMRSQGKSGRNFAEIVDLGTEKIPAGSQVWLRARVSAVRAKGNAAFLVLRQDSFNTVQACMFKDKENPAESKNMLKWLGELRDESIVDVQGVVSAAETSCSQSNVEIQIQRCYCVSRADVVPFLLLDAARTQKEVEESQDTDRPFPVLGQEIRLNNRWVDLRVPANNAIMRIQSAVCQLFREALYAEKFVEIHTPKLLAGESEGGADVFRTDYFGKPAVLAQSPQLYKQMAVSADLERVFEVGPIFRAEKSNSRRHLCEFTGLDLEMAIHEHYDEALGVVHRMFKYVFEGLEKRFSKELEVIRTQYFSEPVAFTDEPCVIHWNDGLDMLREAGMEDVEDFGDLSNVQELKLGELVKEKYGTDFFMLDRYPTDVRPFYTMPCEDDGRYSNSYDMFIRGQEICSGAQRIHEPALLRETLKAKGVNPEPLESYIAAFSHGASPHAGAGIGLERVVFLYLGLDNVRKASLFPRDPSRCTP